MEEMLRKTKVLLKSYQMAKFAVMVRTQEVEDELFDSDMKSIENLIDSVLGEDLMLNGKYLENKLVEGKCKIIRRIVLPQKISHNNQ